MKKFLYLFVLMLCGVSTAMAQEKKVRVMGNVVDYETSEPVMMATVVSLT